MRDLETIRLALTAAETGHLCSALCTPPAPPRRWTASSTCFRRPKKKCARDAVGIAGGGDLANAVQLKDGSGRVAAHEIMLGTAAIRNLIRENKIAQMYSSIQTGNNMACRRWTKTWPT